MELTSSSKTEMNGFLKDWTFIPVEESEFKRQRRIFGLFFIDELKIVVEYIKKKSRLVEQNYADDDYTYIPTKAPLL